MNRREYIFSFSRFWKWTFSFQPFWWLCNSISCGFILHFPDGEWSWESFLCLLVIWIAYFVNRLYIFSIGLSVIFLLIYESYSGCESLIWCMQLQISFPLWSCLLILLIMSFDEQVLLDLILSNLSILCLMFSVSSLRAFYLLQSHENILLCFNNFLKRSNSFFSAFSSYLYFPYFSCFLWLPPFLFLLSLLLFSPLFLCPNKQHKKTFHLFIMKIRFVLSLKYSVVYQSFQDEVGIS